MSLPPSEIPLGAIRFNSDSQKLEYYDGAQWLQVSTFSPLLNGGARGVFGGGFSPTLGNRNTIEYITISTTGNAVDFGNLISATRTTGSASSSTRGLFAGGILTPVTNFTNNINYVTISSTGDAQDFGDLRIPVSANSGCSSSTRGIFLGGFDTPSYYNMLLFLLWATQ
jgi:hypothetical protein